MVKLYKRYRANISPLSVSGTCQSLSKVPWRRKSQVTWLVTTMTRKVMSRNFLKISLHLQFIKYAHLSFLQVTHKISTVFEVLIGGVRGMHTDFCRIPTNCTDSVSGLSSRFPLWYFLVQSKRKTFLHCQLYSVYGAKLLNILPWLAQKTVLSLKR